MPSACDAFELATGSRKRSFEEDEDLRSKRSSKRPCKQPATHIPTPPPSTSFTYERNTGDHTAWERPFQTSSRSEPGIIRNRAIEPSPTESPPISKRRRRSYCLEKWLNDSSAETSDQKRRSEDIIATSFNQHEGLDDIRRSTTDQGKKLQDSSVVKSIEPPLSLLDYSTTIWEADDDQMSQQGNQTAASTVSAQTERLDPTSSAYWGTLKRNGIIIDHAGLNIPEEVKWLIDKHIRKKRDSPRLDHQDQAKIKNLVTKVWHKAETTVSEIIKSPLFDLEYPTLTEGGNTLWTKQPLPRNLNAPLPILIPKPDKHFGFQLVIDSGWSEDELSVAEHPTARPYIQPSRENICPCLMIEVKSEATKGNLYAAEAQAAGAGAHRVASLLWLLDVVEPDRKRASTDALAFTSVVSQREAVVYVNFYNPANKTYHMSFIDTYYFVKDADAQGCRDHHKNVAEWMLDILQPILRDLLTKAHPLSKAWKKGRSVSTMVDPNETFASDNGLPNKSRRKGQDAEPRPGPETQTQPHVG